MKVRIYENLHFASGNVLKREIGIFDTDKLEDIQAIIHIGDTSDTSEVMVEEVEK